ncbi:Sec-independent protein translocase protein TatB [Novosphingobium sp. EMRT-2]|uniref:Sec-independent protein translocase protein TatB n=1 Tax=Novosphingobium sp. EMRT-2 TaxID=2571749 RepID=UPI0010BDD2A3|nr:Sec-independent protein translocase protein TatB [Novosphingobium sp. EMRT-2]QCI93319.1 twin-arginine translocase subunit TatB [Novosphingobium sp. EMRT-2]
MFDVAPSELLLVAIVAIVVIGPKDLPLALRTAGRWIGKIRRVSNHFRAGIETMIREAEMEEMERKWREQNATIMAQDGGKAAEGQTPEAAADQVAAPGVIPEVAAHAPTPPVETAPAAPSPQTDAPRLL